MVDGADGGIGFAVRGLEARRDASESRGTAVPGESETREFMRLSPFLCYAYNESRRRETSGQGIWRLSDDYR